MQIITRNLGQGIKIGDAKVWILESSDSRVSIGIEADRETVPVHRIDDETKRPRKEHKKR